MDRPAKRKRKELVQTTLCVTGSRKQRRRERSPPRSKDAGVTLFDMVPPDEETRTVENRVPVSSGSEPTVPVSLEAEAAVVKGSDDLSSDTFNPALEATALWQSGKEYLFSRLVLSWRLVESFRNSGAGTKRKCSVALSNSYRSILAHSPKDFVVAIYLTLQKLGPPYLSKETGVGDTALIKSVCETYGRSEQQVKAEMQKTGDLGVVAYQSKCSMTTLFPPARLTLASVWTGFHKIADSKGANAQVKKREHLKHLLIGAVEDEPKFIIRFMSKQMRMGVRAATVINALSRAILTIKPPRRDIASAASLADCVAELKRGIISPKLAAYMNSLELVDQCRLPTEEEVSELEEAMKGCYSRFPNLGLVVLYALHSPTPEELAVLCQITPGVPVAPMLARPTKSYTAVLDSMLGHSFRAEYKYDGERCQIHIERTPNGGVSVHLFSRNMESLDEKYPDVMEAVKRCASCAQDAILDSEVVAINSETNKIESFQVLSTRKRKDVSASSVAIKVCLYIFDCLRLDGEPVTTKPLLERLDLLKAAIREEETRVCYATGKNISVQSNNLESRSVKLETIKEGSPPKEVKTEEPAEESSAAPVPADVAGLEELETMMLSAVEKQTEGLMIKSLVGDRSLYEPSQRTVNWLKLKKDYLDSRVCDSLDLCVIGAFYGMGKRSGGYGCFLMAVYDSLNQTYRSICKVATGFSEQDLTNFTESLTKASVQPRNYECKIVPDVWIEAGELWEIRCADLTISPVHTACGNLPGPAQGKGVALRFPRFIRRRTDKEKTTTPNQILQLYHDQFTGDAASSNVNDDGDDLLI